MGKRGPKPKAFEDQVAKSNGCWEWQGSRFSGRYGRAIVDRKSVLAHRLAYEREYGPIPDGMYVCHRCDNPICVRPDHLFLGSPADNLYDMKTKGRSLIGVRNRNAKLTDEAVQQIRKLYSQGNITQKALAEHFGVVEGAVWNVLHDQTWRHVDG